MLSYMTLITSAALAAAAADALNPADCHTRPALQLIQPSSSSETGCPSPQVPCFSGCMDPDQLCCKHVRNPTPWTCSTTEKCGPHPIYGCLLPKSSTTPTATLPPMTSTFEPTSLPRPAGSGFNPTYTVSIPAVVPAPRKTGSSRSSGDGDMASFTAGLTPVSSSSTKRETCYFDASGENTSGSERTGEVCPGSSASSLTAPSSTTISEAVSGSGVRFGAGSSGVVTLVGVVVMLVGRIF